MTILWRSSLTRRRLRYLHHHHHRLFASSIATIDNSDQTTSGVVDDGDGAYPMSQFEREHIAIVREDHAWMSKMARIMPTVQEKIDFINPYQRPWTRFERTWHRPYHEPLIAPRQAWQVNPNPLHYDCLPFHKYITNMRVIDDEQEFNSKYSQSRPTYTASFERSVCETLQDVLLNKEDGQIASNRIIRSLVDDILVREQLRNIRTSYSSRCESFWIRSGFEYLYEDVEDERKRLEKYESLKLESEKLAKEEAEIENKKREKGAESIITVKKVDKNKLDDKTWNDARRTFDVYRRMRQRKTPVFPCDDYRKLGQLAFVFRDSLAAHIRSRMPLAPIDIFDDGEPVAPDRPLLDEDYCYSPRLLLANCRDPDPLWMAPGYEPDCGDPYRFGVVALRDSSEIEARCDNRWQLDDDDDAIRRETYTAAAISSLFSWLNGQAHALGFTQYNDLTYPLVSQIVLTDGRNFFFAIAQLNTIAIDNRSSTRENVCYVRGPMPLFHESDFNERKFYFEGREELNVAVLEQLIRMFRMTPTYDPNVANDMHKLMPYVVHK